MKRQCTAMLCILIALLCCLSGCTQNQTYHGVTVEWLDSSYTPEAIYFDNDWLQRKSLSAAEGLDLRTTKGFFAYLDQIDPLLLHYFVRNFEITNITHYDNGIWAIRYTLSKNARDLIGYDIEIYFIDEATGEIYNYECWSSNGTKAWE